MKQMQTILQPYATELASKGYDETTLASPEKPGQLLLLLHTKLIRAVNAGLTDARPVSFIIQITGFFNDKADEVSFRFHFQYRPPAGQLDLKSLLSQMSCVQRLFIMPGSGLPHCHEVYQSLLQARQRQQSRAGCLLCSNDKHQQP